MGGEAGLSASAEKRVGFALVGAAFLWGTWWVPAREIYGLGFDGPTAAAAGYGLAAVLLLPFVLRRPGRLLALGWLGLACALSFSGSFALWSDGLVHGNVARVTLLFYLAPVWGTFLARVVLGEPITVLRGVAIALGLAGAVVLLGGLDDWPVPRDRAEWFGLAGGVCWALALLFVHMTADRSDAARAFLIVVVTAPVFLLVGDGAVGGTAPAGAGDTTMAVLWLVVFAGVWILPVVWLTIYSASRMDPGRVAIILILEVVVAIVTSAIFTGEAFGWQEAAGAVAIMLAGVMESLPRLVRGRA